jgi:hypothetical protein
MPCTTILFAWRIFAYALILILVVLITTPPRLLADETSHREVARQVMLLINTENMITPALDQLREQQMKKLKGIAYPGKSPEKDSELKQRVADYLEKKLSWSNLQDGYIDVFAGIFTEEELKELLDFYSSPVGRKLLNVGMELRTELLKSTQTQLTGMILEIRKIEDDFISEQKKNSGRDQ